MLHPPGLEFLEARLLLSTTPNDPSYRSEWGLSAVAASSAWDTTTGSSAVVVADIDTGLDYKHPDLYQNVWLNPGEIPAALRRALKDADGDRAITFRDLNAAANKGKVSDVDRNGRIDAADLLTRARYGGWANGVDEGRNGYVDDIIGWDFANDDRSPMDQDGHGTHTAGTIGATGDNGTGVSGVNWRVSLMAVKIFADGGYGASDADVAAAIRYSADNGARVSNNSWGGPDYSWQIHDAIAHAGAKGQLFVAAAGNDSNNLDASYHNDYPTKFALDNILTVGATDPDGRRAYYSNYGRATVDVFAPGSDVLSTFPRGRYDTLSGTSMAAPHVTGAAALMLADNPKLTAAQLKARIMNGANQAASMVNVSVSGGELNIPHALGNTAGSRYRPTTGSTGSTGSPAPGRGRRRSIALTAAVRNSGDVTVPPPPSAAPSATGRRAGDDEWAELIEYGLFH